jgi:hypothetical protein
MSRRRPRIHQSKRTKRPARLHREYQVRVMARFRRACRKNQVMGIDPTKPAIWRVRVSVYGEE